MAVLILLIAPQCDSHDPNRAKLRNQRLVIVIVIVIFSASFDYD
jgi:hypothetical protein